MNEEVIKRIAKEAVSETFKQIGLEIHDETSVEKTKQDIQDFRSMIAGIRKAKTLAFVELFKMAFHAIIIWFAAYVIMKHAGP